MNEHENHMTYEALDWQTERSPDDLSQEEYRLIQDIYALSEAYARENGRSLEQIWSRFVQCQEHPLILQEKQAKEPGGKQFALKGKSMFETDISQEAGFSALNSLPVTRPRRSLWPILRTSGAAAIVLLTILSWMLLSFGLHHTSQPAPVGSSQKGISSGKVLCSVSYSTNSSLELGQPALDWSMRGVIATATPYLETFSAPTCASQMLMHMPSTAVRPVWSPDGKRLLLLHGDVADVVDASTGNVLASFKGDPSSGFVQAIWAANETQIIATEVQVLSHTTQSVKVRVWNASTGAPIRTSLTFADGVLIGSAWISPDGALLALQKSDHRIEFWNTASGRLVSTTSSSVAGNSQPAAWAPNSQFLAIGLPNPHWPSVPSEVQVWSAATGQLIATFSDSDTFEGTIGGLAWSEDGKYLAESSGQIHVWDVSARQLVATFGKVEKSSWIIAVSWAPDGSKLASLTANVTRSPHMQNRLSVWQLL